MSNAKAKKEKEKSQHHSFIHLSIMFRLYLHVFKYCLTLQV